MIIDHAGGLHEGVDDGGGPTKLKPAFFRALDMASDSGVVTGGTSASVCHRFWMGRPLTNCQRNSENEMP